MTLLTNGKLPGEGRRALLDCPTDLRPFDRLGRPDTPSSSALVPVESRSAFVRVQWVCAAPVFRTEM